MNIGHGLIEDAMKDRYSLKADVAFPDNISGYNSNINNISQTNYLYKW